MNARQMRVLDLIEADPEGVSKSEIADAIPAHVDTLRNDLRKLRDAGAAVCSAVGGCRAVWFVGPNAAEVRRQYQMARLQKIYAGPQWKEPADNAPIKQTTRAAGTWTADTKTAASWIPL